MGTAADSCQSWLSIVKHRSSALPGVFGPLELKNRVRWSASVLPNTDQHSKRAGHSTKLHIIGLPPPPGFAIGATIKLCPKWPLELCLVKSIRFQSRPKGLCDFRRVARLRAYMSLQACRVDLCLRFGLLASDHSPVGITTKG